MKEVSQVFKDWTPLAKSLDLVRSSCELTSKAVKSEITRFIKGERLDEKRIQFESFDQLFSSVSEFTNTPTQFFVIPTKSEWSVLWNNSFLCDGYDSLCSCITMKHGYETIHWSATDTDLIFQAGSKFNYRRRVDGTTKERSVYCGKEDKRWVFHQYGDPILEENGFDYSERLKKDRLNESKLAEILSNFGAFPLDSDFYDFTIPVTVYHRSEYPRTIMKEDFEYIKKRIERQADHNADKSAS